MALGGGMHGMDLGLDSMGGPVPGMGALGALGRGDEDERKRRLGVVMDILKVWTFCERLTWTGGAPW
jgi:hypothetical protein